jgi:translation initiation factor 5A
MEEGRNDSYPMNAGKIKNGCFIIMKTRPAKVIDFSTSKTGKHGGAKIHVIGIDIFNDHRYEEIVSTADNVMVPYVTRKEYQLIDITDDAYCVIMDDNGIVREDIKLDKNNEIHDEIKDHYEDDEELNVVVISSMGIEKIMDYKRL